MNNQLSYGELKFRIGLSNDFFCIVTAAMYCVGLASIMLPALVTGVLEPRELARWSYIGSGLLFVFALAKNQIEKKRFETGMYGRRPWERFRIGLFQRVYRDRIRRGIEH